jgi:hypothetical protein
MGKLVGRPSSISENSLRLAALCEMDCGLPIGGGHEEREAILVMGDCIIESGEVDGDTRCNSSSW